MLLLLIAVFCIRFVKNNVEFEEIKSLDRNVKLVKMDHHYYVLKTGMVFKHGYWNEKEVAKKARNELMVMMANEKILIEIYIIEMLSHPNIVRVIDTWYYLSPDSKFSAMNPKKYMKKYNEQDAQFYLLLEKCNGNLLHSFPENFNYEVVNSMFKEAIRQVLSAVDYLHSNNIAHGDLKFDNVLYTIENGMLVFKLIDFEHARIGRFTEKSIIGGSEYFMSTEVRASMVGFRGKVDLFKADMYSIGKMMYHVMYFGSSVASPTKELASSVPKFNYYKKEEQITIEKYLDMEGLYKENPSFENDPDFQTLMRALMHHEPEKRPSARDLLKGNAFKWLN